MSLLDKKTTGDAVRLLIFILVTTIATGFGIECCIAFSTAGKKAGVGSAGTDRMAPPAMRKPKAWIG